MTKAETTKILAVLKSAYPNFYRSITQEDAIAAVNLWSMMFAENPYELVSAAVMAHIAADTSGFPPNIGQIKDRLLKLTTPKGMTEQEAWGYVQKALRNSTYNHKEEFDRLPDVVQRVVGDSMQLRSWAMMSEDEVGTVVASNFMRSFRAQQQSDRDYAALPESVKKVMIQSGFQRGNGEMTPLFGGAQNALPGESPRK